MPSPFNPATYLKGWGYESWIANNQEKNYCGKLLFIKEGRRCSLHMHKDKTETFYVNKGIVKLEVVENGKNTSYEMEKGEAIDIPPCTPHRFTAIDDDAEIFEFSTYHKDSDSYRIELGDSLGITTS